MAHRTKRKQSGAGYIEVLVSSLILALSLLAALSLYGFSMTLVEKTGDEGYAYNIARRWLEDARQKGFPYTKLPEGTTTRYYTAKGMDSGGTDPNGSSSSFADAKFRMDRVVISDKFTTVSGGATHPADTSLRTVTVTVTRISTGQVVEQTGTTLVRSGV